MITEKFFRVFPFPWYLFSSAGDLLDSDGGTLFHLSSSATTDSQLLFYAGVKYGWTTCPLGFAVYSVAVDLRGRCKLVFPGLKVAGVSTISGKSEGLSIRTGKEEVEKHVSRMMQGLHSIDENFSSIVRSNIHEIRKINTNMYNASYGAEKELDEKTVDIMSVRELVKTVSAFSSILKSRTDFLDFLSNPALSSLKMVQVFPYRRFDKIVRGIRPTAQKRNIFVSISGQSFSSISGIQVFDIAPYLLLDNAVKYAPNGTNVDVIFTENDSSIRVEVCSLGPRIEKSEEERIFDAEFSGENAIKAGKSGSGIGLYATHIVVERLHGGKLLLQQDVLEKEIAGVKYNNIKFVVLLPK